jgi:hypothetical protein
MIHTKNIKPGIIPLSVNIPKIKDKKADPVMVISSVAILFIHRLQLFEIKYSLYFYLISEIIFYGSVLPLAGQHPYSVNYAFYITTTA